MTAPVALLALAAAMPLVVAGEAAALAGGSPKVLAVAATHDQAETIARCVNEAARQLCGSRVALPISDSFVVVEPLAFVGTVAPQPQPRRDRPTLSPPLIDMPPPAR